ncbi:hypothetical protein ABH931_000246 [Streptacidiphilus sp. MAP12-33]|uniref:hypothetical protein n=1 Tax=Streptacidiphilus sp. MAP12-33 TaxID=3156266 RepID=UPI0035168D93
MRISRRRLRSAAVLAAATLCASVSFTEAAHAAAAPTVSISIDGTTPGTTPTVSGVIGVTATVTSSPGAPATQIEYYVARSGLVQTIAIQPGQCDASCTLHWTIDTAAVRPGQTGGAALPVIPDGSRFVGAFAASAGATSSVASTPVDIDNHRPNLLSSNLPSIAGVATADQLTFNVTPAVSPTAPAGTTIADVQLEAAGPGAQAWPVSHFTDNGDGTWTVHFAKGSLPGGFYSVYAVATDSNGIVSAPRTGEVIVDSGFTVTPQATATRPDGQALYADVTHPGWTGCGQSFSYPGVTHLQLDVDGQLWQDSAVDAGLLVWDGHGCRLPAAGTSGTPLKRLPLGRHTLTWVVTDNAGVQQSVDQQVTVALPLTSNWPVLDQTVVAGSPLQVKAKVSAPDGFSKLRSWSVVLNGIKVVASGTGATPVSLSLPTPLTRETGGTVTLHLVSDSGLMSAQTFSYQTGWATAAYAHVSATSVKRGSYVSLYASDWERINGTWHFEPPFWATVQYQWSVAGSGVWHNDPLSGTSPSHPAPGAVRMRVGSNVCFRAVYGQNPHLTQFGYDNIPATSAPVCVTAH